MKNARVDWNNEDELRALVGESNSRSEVLKKLGLVPSSNMVTLRKYLTRYGISTEHFDPSLDRPTRRNGSTQLPIDQLLTKGRPISDRYGIKQRLIRDKVLPYECEKCHIGNRWFGQELTLQLEHKNGDGTDYRIENLCFLCPNCHSQTDETKRLLRIREVAYLDSLISCRSVCSNPPSATNLYTYMQSNKTPLEVINSLEPGVVGYKMSTAEFAQFCCEIVIRSSFEKLRLWKKPEHPHQRATDCDFYELKQELIERNEQNRYANFDIKRLVERSLSRGTLEALDKFIKTTELKDPWFFVPQKNQVELKQNLAPLISCTRNRLVLVTYGNLLIELTEDTL